MIAGWSSIVACGRRLRSDENGASAVEFAMVGAVLILVMVGTIQLGWALQVRNEMAKAVDEAARFTLLPGKGPADFDDKLEDLLAHYDEDRLVIPAYERRRIGEMWMNVFSVEYQLPLFVPFVSADLGSLSVTRRTPAS